MSSVPVLRNYIHGEFAASAEVHDVLNPATGAVLARSPLSSQQEVDRAIAAARAAQKGWARKPAIERAGHLRRIAAKLRENVPGLAHTITEEQGKIAGLAEVEVNFTADYLDYMAEWVRRLEGEIITSDRPDENIFLFRKPLGVVAGNTIVIKPSEETPINCHLFTKLLAQTDLPPGVFNVVYGTGATGGALSGACRRGHGQLHRQRGHRQPHYGRGGRQHHQAQPRARRQGAADIKIMRKEIFGPVLPVQVVDGLDEAIALTNDCEYGLTSSIYTRDLSKALHAIREIDFGETTGV
ncbi:aldehyde dehydrogenase family protein [Xylophilus sp.]|uniref:aldehyde dehydrogenase family protein n=1 Tax=Xylophilus sp. TaxID=2653893 RepID=UPI0013B6A2FD|nr:aldehyde dehydrogenase family protein [Xylophilus sp.]KAF1049999.1 MAG: Lactaldehyde dehydrogenase [Xylophilus sp.]